MTKEATEIAGAILLGVPRTHDGLCAPPVFAIPTPPGIALPLPPAGGADPDGEDSTAPPSPAPLTDGASGMSGPAGALRILVVGDSMLDGLCALGLGGRVVGRVASLNGMSAPDYLGPEIAALPVVGAVGAVAMDKVRELRPDLVVASADLVGALGPELADTAPLISPQPADGAEWKDQFLALGELFGRQADAKAQIDAYERFVAEQREDGALDPAHTRASVVRFADSKITVEGPGSFAGSVLSDIGVDRPPSQRCCASAAGGRAGADQVVKPDQLQAADADLIYVSFGEPRSFGESVVASEEWKRLGAVRDQRVFAVFDQWWHQGSGPIAAKDVVIDVVGSLNAPPPA